MNDSNAVIVTGAAGYIGSHACKLLRNSGFIPVGVDNLSTGWCEAVKFGPLEEIDLLNKKALKLLFLKYSPIAVMHFAAFSQVGESVENPGKYWRNNLLGSLNLIETLVECNCKNIIFSSTCATYGNHDNIILTEESPQLPTNPYGASKRAVEEIIKQFSKSHQLKYVIFRYFNVAGADPEAEIGEFHRPETHLIPFILDAVSGKRDAITIFGTDYNTTDGTCIRDYVHVCDTVEAHILGLNWILNNNDNRIYNLGTGVGFSVREVINHVHKITNQEVPIIEGSRRPGDATRLVSASDLAQVELSWAPNLSTLDQIISDAWRWHKTGGYSR